MQNEIVIKKCFGKFMVFKMVDGLPNWLGDARSMKSAKAIADRKLTIKEKYNYMACGNGAGMGAY